MTPNQAAAILEHEVTSLGVMAQPGMTDQKNGKNLVSLSAPEIIDE